MHAKHILKLAIYIYKIKVLTYKLIIKITILKLKQIRVLTC